MLTDIRQAEERANATIASAKEAAEARKKQAHADAATLIAQATEAARTAKEAARVAGQTAGDKEATKIKADAAAAVEKQRGTFTGRIEQVAATIFGRIVNGK